MRDLQSIQLSSTYLCELLQEAPLPPRSLEYGHLPTWLVRRGIRLRRRLRRLPSISQLRRRRRRGWLPTGARVCSALCTPRATWPCSSTPALWPLQRPRLPPPPPRRRRRPRWPSPPRPRRLALDRSSRVRAQTITSRTLDRLPPSEFLQFPSCKYEQIYNVNLKLIKI